MKRALAVVLAATALAAGCGGSGGGGGSQATAPAGTAKLIRASQDAAANATAVAFDMTIDLRLDGNLRGAGVASAFLEGPLSLGLEGQVGHVDGGIGKFDVHFALNFTGGSFSGEALSPDGRTAYVQMPSLLGPGWKSIVLSTPTSSGDGSSDSQSFDQLKALGLDPAKWLKNLSVSSSDSTDTIAADLDVAALIADTSALSGSKITARDQRQIDEVVTGVKTAHGSESFDRSTHLPSAIALELALHIPSDLQRESSGLTGFDFKIDAKFSDWNKDFSVSTPSGATPFDPNGILGGLASGA
jgi:hypothetical protein